MEGRAVGCRSRPSRRRGPAHVGRVMQVLVERPAGQLGTERLRRSASPPGGVPVKRPSAPGQGGVESVRAAGEPAEAFAHHALPAGDVVDQLLEHAQGAGAAAVVDGLGDVDAAARAESAPTPAASPPGRRCRAPPRRRSSSMNRSSQTRSWLRRRVRRLCGDHLDQRPQRARRLGCCRPGRGSTGGISSQSFSA